MSSLEERTIYLKNKQTSEKAIMVLLTEEGLEAHKKGEPIDFHKGHISCIGDYKKIIQAEFQ